MFRKRSKSYRNKNCILNANNETKSEISQLLLKTTDNINNQNLWQQYKQSTSKTVFKNLYSARGNIYQDFAIAHTYELNFNRLIILNYLVKQTPYEKEPTISDELDKCLKGSKNPIDTTACYQKEEIKYNNNISQCLAKLQKEIPENDYKILLNNQNDWIKYKNNTQNLITPMPEVKKAQIMKLITEERSGQLYSLYELFKQD